GRRTGRARGQAKGRESAAECERASGRRCRGDPCPYGPTRFRLERNPPTLAPAGGSASSLHRLHVLDDLADGFLRAAVEHAAVVLVEQRVLDARVARTLAALDH